jgi:uncharacterized protein YutE (UPF0331/DUF86 family)
MEKTLAYIEENMTIFSNHPTWVTPVEHKALERIIVSVIEGILDVGNAMIDGFIMRDPGSYEDIIDILEDEKVVSTSLAEQLKVLVRLRKVLVQEYLDIDHQELKNKLSKGKDAVMSFCHSVRHYLENELGPVSAFKK